MSLGETIRRHRITAGYTVEELANRIGVSRQTLFRYENGQIATVPTGKLSRLAEIFATTPAALLAGEAAGELLPLPELRRIPVVIGEAGGRPVYAESPRLLPLATVDGAPDFCYTVVGDRMAGARITDGDTVFLVKADSVTTGDIALLSIRGELELYRVYSSEEEEKLILTAENPAFPPLVFLGEERGEVAVLGRVLFFQSRVK